MYIKEFKEFVNKLGVEFDDYVIVNGEISVIKPDDTNNFKEQVFYKVNSPVMIAHIDKEEKTLSLFHQTKEDVTKILNDKS